jgi:3-isopropylmalate/(R)-2-methylmalate dehydratase large subunit
MAADQTTFDYIKGRSQAPKGADWDRAVRHWKEFVSDEGATYDREIVIDVATLRPMVTWGTNPGHACDITQSIPRLADVPEHEKKTTQRALEYIALTEGSPIGGTPVDWAFIGSCTNGRIEDLRIAAQVLEGKKVAAGVTMYIVPGSEQVMKQAHAEGLVKVFEDAGVDFRMPGCSMCLAMNDDKVPQGERCISSTNRNFMGRQGPGSRTHLASPATVAASAIAGKISSAEEYF